MDKIAQAKLDEELAHVIAEATQSRVSITEAIVMIRKMEKAGWVFTNAKLEADMKKAEDEKAAAEREKLAAQTPPTAKSIIPPREPDPPLSEYVKSAGYPKDDGIPVKRVDPIAPDHHPFVHEPFPAPEKPTEVAPKP